MPQYFIRRKAVLVFTIIVAALASACAGGSRLVPDEPPPVASPRVMWEDGLRAVETGEAMLTRGEQRLALGRQQIRDGEAKVRDGTLRAAEAKAEYERLAATADGLSAAERTARNQALRETGSRWQAALDVIKDGNRLIAKGNANVDRGEEEIRDGRRMMETGSILMRNSYRSRSGQPLLPLPSGD